MALYRVYVHEWVTVYPSQSTGSNGHDECAQVFIEKYEGRILADDVRIVEMDGGHHALELRRPNLLGEYVAPGAAEALRNGCGDFAVLAELGSDEEQSLLEYGRKMLPA